MTDILLQTGSVPSILSKPVKPPQKPNTKAKRPPTKSTIDPGVVSTLQKAVKDANDTLLWLKDGLSPQERESNKVAEERKQVLRARMLNVNKVAISSQNNALTWCLGRDSYTVGRCRQRIGCLGWE